MPRYLLDANVILRILAGDHPDHLARAAALFESASRGECTLLLYPWIVAETVFTLQSFYDIPQADIGSMLLTVVNAPGVETADLDVILDCLHRFAHTRISFVDCLLAAQAHSLGIPPASFDRDLDKFPDIKRYEP